MTQALVVYTTVSDRSEADRMAKALVAERLAACVTIVPHVSSRYRWKGKIEKQKEFLLIIKTFRRHYASLERRMKKLHSYTVPEILALPVVRGNPAYVQWMKDSVR